MIDLLEPGRLNRKRAVIEGLVDKYGGFWLDGTSGFGGSLPTIDTWTPKRSKTVVPGVFSQVGAATKPSVDAVGVAFDTDEFLLSTAGAAAWAWLHAAAGCSLFFVVKRTGGTGVQIILDTCNGNLFQHGVTIAYNQGTNLVYALVNNGSGTSVVSATLDFDNWSGDQSVLHLVEFTWSQAAGYMLRVDGGSSARMVTGDAVGAPSVSNPSGTATIGSIVVGSVQFLTGNVAELVGFVGVPSQSDRFRVRNALAAKWGIGLSVEVPASASDCASDPRLVLPSSVDALEGEPFEMLIDNLYLRDGACSQAMSSDLPVYTLKEDRWRFYPTTPGSYAMTVSSANRAQLGALDVVAQLAGGAPTRSCVFVGDSITVATGHGGFVKYCKDALGTKLTLLGTQSTAGYAHEGYSGQTWAFFATNGASPFANIATWKAAIGGVDPDFMFFNLGTNDLYSAALATIDATITTAFGHAETLLAALRSTFPSTKFVIGSGFPGNGRGSAWGGDAARFTYRSKMHRLFERTLQDFGGREGDGIVVCPTHLPIDPIVGYPLADQVHPDVLVGHPQAANVMRATLVANW